jgi:hypothetical protein
MWVAIVGVAWGAAVVWALHERYGRKLAEDRLTVRERIAGEQSEPVTVESWNERLARRRALGRRV